MALVLFNRQLPATLACSPPYILEKPQLMCAKQSFGIGFLLAAAILLLGPYTNYSPPAVDMWFPTGYFTNFADLVERFGLTPYYLSRLPYILPGVGIYAVFAPHVANFILNLASFGTTVSSLLLVASGQLGKRWAISLTVLFALNSYLLFANLWDYSDGPAIAYFSAGLAIASTAENRVTLRTRCFAAIGACWISALLTNFIIGILILPFALDLVFWRSSSNREVRRRLGGLVGGALVAFVPLMAVSKILLGAWFFPAPQIAQLLYAAQHPEFLPGMWGTGSDWIAGAYRLGALYGPVLVAVPCLFIRRCRTPDFLATFAVCATGAMLYLAAELADKVLLRAVYHGTFLLIFSFIQTVALVKLVLGSATSASDARSGSRVLVAMALVISILFACVPDLGAATWSVLGIAAFLFGATIMISRPVAWRTSVAAVAVAILLNLAPASDREVRWIYFSNKSLYSAALETQSLLKSGIIKGEQIRFWFDPEDSQAPLFKSVNALYLWLYRDLTKSLPTMQQAEIHEILPPGISIIHLCTGECPLEKRQALLRDVRVDVASTYTWMVRPPGGDAFTIVVQKTSPKAHRDKSNSE